MSKYEEKFDELAKDPERQMDFMLISAPFIQEYTDAQSQTDRHTIYNRYLELIDPSALPTKKPIVDVCPGCGSDEMTAECGFNVCTSCGLEGLITFTDLSYQEEIDLNPVGMYTYKRINHFNEWVAQFQGQESTIIPDDVLEKIRDDMKRTRLEPARLNRERMRIILKKLRLAKYYEHIPAILNQIANIKPKKLTADLEARMRLMFSEIQGPFERHCPGDRKNFLSYSFVLHKFCQLLDADEYIECFPLLKSKEKLKACDFIWKEICKDLSYEYIPTI